MIGFAVDGLDLPFIVAGLTFLGLALWLLHLDFANRLNRSLALFLFLTGLADLVRVVDGDLSPEGRAIRHLGVYTAIAAPFALLYFVLAYEERFGTYRWRRLALVPLVALAAVALLAFAVDHDLWFNSGPLRQFERWFGQFMPALVALHFAREAWRQEAAPRRHALLLISLAFGLAPPFAILHLLLPLMQIPLAVTWPYVLSLIPLGFLVGGLVRIARGGDPLRAREARRYLAALSLPVASVFIMALLVLASVRAAAWFMVVSMGLWLAALPVLATYAIVRHQLFDIDVKIKWGIARGTVAAILLAVFFVVAQVAQEFLTESLGWAAGGMAAGVVVFAIAPLQRFAERVADVALPDAKPATALSRDERHALYREQARVAWSDGSLSADERRMLEAMRARLGLTHEEAQRIEGEVLAPA